MAEFVAALFASSEATAATATAFSATEAATSAISLSDVFAGVGAVASIAGGFAGAEQARQEAELLRLQAEREEIKGLQEVNEINRALAERAAINNASTRAGGLTLVGTPERINEELQATANRNISIARTNASTAASTKRAQASQAEIGGTATFIRGIGGAATSLVGGKRRKRTSALNLV